VRAVSCCWGTRAYQIGPRPYFVIDHSRPRLSPASLARPQPLPSLLATIAAPSTTLRCIPYIYCRAPSSLVRQPVTTQGSFVCLPQPFAPRPCPARLAASAASHPYSGCSQTTRLGLHLTWRLFAPPSLERAPRPSARTFVLVLRQHLKLKLNALLVSIDQHARTVAVANPCLLHIPPQPWAVCHPFVPLPLLAPNSTRRPPTLQELGLLLVLPKHEARALARALAPPAPSPSPQLQSWFDRIHTPAPSITHQHMPAAADCCDPLCA
jgi:hypothetical protein